MNNRDTQAVLQCTVKVLLISPFETDHQHFETILRHSSWQQHGARTRAGALELLRKNHCPVVVCEGELPDGTWKDVLAELGRFPCPPLLVVTSRLADDQLWSEALNLGAYNVLAKPLNEKEVFHVLSMAWLFWKRQWEPAQLLARTA